jgi:hypothetical protein
MVGSTSYLFVIIINWRLIARPSFKLLIEFSLANVVELLSNFVMGGGVGYVLLCTQRVCLAAL